ncbi:MAG: hypothetical protein M1817_001077 [Caeruleum heppii]|nr:MAG: hypothetical protein M1817_001077 [Caeruleum heppii]
MVPSPASPRRASDRRDLKRTGPRPFNRSNGNLRRGSDELEDKAAVMAELQRERTQAKRQTLDLGKPLGPYDTNTVRDRVRQWQAQGGGVVEQPDPLADAQENGRPEKKAASKQKDTKTERAATKKQPHSAEKPSANRSRNTDRDEANVQREERSSSAPRKRVVSDRHWVKKKPLNKEKRQDPAQTPPKSAEKLLPDDGIRVTPIRDSNARRPRQRSEGMRTPTKAKLDDDGIRVYSAPQNRSEQLRPRRSTEDLRPSSRSASGDKSDAERPSSWTTPSPPRERKSTARRQRQSSKTYQMSGALDTEDSIRRRRPSRRDSRTPERSRSPSDASDFVQRRKSKPSTPRVNILKEVYDGGKKIFTKNEASPAPIPTGNRIEAWLSDTPDPFVDGSLPPPVPPVPLEEPPETRKVPDPNKIIEQHFAKLDGTDGRRLSRDRKTSGRHKRVHSSPHQPMDPSSPDTSSVRLDDHHQTLPTPSETQRHNLVDEAPPLSPTPLKRAGAKRNATSPARSRRKSTPVKSSAPSDAELGHQEDANLESSDQTLQNEECPPTHTYFKRPFPSTGRHQLSTIASVETFRTRSDNHRPPTASDVSQSTMKDNATERKAMEDEARDTLDTQLPRDMPPGKGLKRRLTSHADLISVLSMPRAEAKSIRSARSIRTNRSRLATATIADLMNELTTDESKYMRELRTLVDGVIPVLLSCVLSKSDSAVAAGLFSPGTQHDDDPTFTRPIVDMGIALERLKNLHDRIPQTDPTQLLHWARGAHKVYREYLKSWRMGFQDVVVNLAPATGRDTVPATEDATLNDGLPRNAEGDIIDGDGERVDVAFLLKRPLVRIKFLAKTLKGINLINPSQLATEESTRYQELVAEARQRSNDERARLEDESANNIDPTRARDPRTLAPMTGAAIDRSRRVRARDYFNLGLQHSSGQRVDCKVELLLRDDAAGQDGGGDLLICEIDAASRWLLFPPLTMGRVSARNGDVVGEIVVMVRGTHGPHAHEWQELLSLHTEDEEAGSEWVNMLGLTPVPPAIVRQMSFRKSEDHSRLIAASAADSKSVSWKSRTPSPTEIEVPIGEQAVRTSHPHDREPSWAGDGTCDDLDSAPHVAPASISRESPTTHDHSLSSSSAHRPQRIATEPGTPTKDLNEAMRRAGDESGSPSRRHRQSRMEERSPKTPKPSRLSRLFGRHSKSPSSPPSQIESSNRYAEHSSAYSPPGSEVRSCASAPESTTVRPNDRQHVFEQGLGSKNEAEDDEKPSRPRMHHRTSSVPSMDLPVIQKLRKTPASVLVSGEPDSGRASSAPMPEEAHNDRNVLRKQAPHHEHQSSLPADDKVQPLSPNEHRGPSSKAVKGSTVPKLRSPTSKTKVKSPRRSSSPLKHQYEPSSSSEVSSDSEDSIIHREDEVSDTSEEEELEDGDAPTPLLPVGELRRLGKPSPKGSLYSLPNGTLTPSQSASQAPYKTVPQQPTKANKTIASIFSWEDKGFWRTLHPDECSIVVTPGLIEAFELTAEHSKPLSLDPEDQSARSSPTLETGERPLVALELTPLVPLRRGTAIDISIRSPPTAQSKIRSSNNVMFRSRNPEECEALYAMINYARINNPTYIALQNARGPYGDGYGASMGSRGMSSRSSGRWGFGRRSSYRASTRGTPSLAMSESSVGSRTSAFSALRRFSNGGSRMFNISRSTVGSRRGGSSPVQSVYSSSSGSSFVNKDGTATPPKSSRDGAAPIGLSNTKIRLYQRELASRWRDMGSARLSISSPPPGWSCHGATGSEKRIVVHGKTAGESLLDVCLGPSAFERVARTGIALSIWEEVVGPNGEIGQVGAVGGVGARTRVYMIQMKSEAETAYTFALVGTHKY